MNEVKDAPRERAQCAIEASNIYNLLTTLRYRLEYSKGAEAWYSKAKLQAVKDGLLGQFKEALELLVMKLPDRYKINNLAAVLLWSLHKKEVDHILGRLERLKSHVEVILYSHGCKCSLPCKASVLTAEVNFSKTSKRTPKPPRTPRGSRTIRGHSLEELKEVARTVRKAECEIIEDFWQDSTSLKDA